MASRMIKEASELPTAATTMGPLRPLLSDQAPRKQAVSMAGTVRAMLNNRMYREARVCTFWSVLQWNNLV